MRSHGRWLAILLICTALTGCWDSEYLKDSQLGYGVGYDLAPDGDLLQTVELVLPRGEQTSPKNEIHSGSGQTLRDTSDSVRRNVTGNIRYLKYGFLLLGKTLAERELFQHLDVSYRDPRNPTSAVKLIVADGMASEILQKKKVGEMLIGEFITKKVKSLEEMSVFREETVETIFTLMMDPGQDFTLPYIKLEGSEIVVKGTALFRNQRMTGSLTPDESILLTLLSGKTGKTARLTLKANEGEVHAPTSYITIDAGGQKKKRKMKVNVKPNGNIEVDLKLDLSVLALEYPKGKLTDTEIKRLNESLSGILTQKASGVIQKLQQARCDVLGIGRQLIAYHPRVWKKKDWDEDYRYVKFHPKVNVKIVGIGVLN